jgi:CheY-like chemotaxis protein
VTAADTTPPPPPRVIDRRRVLVVDDEAAVLHATARLLERHGWQVEAVTSPEAALDHLQSAARFDCLITDLSMPGLSGLELAEAARTLHPALPIVLATGYLDTDAAIGPDATSVSAVLTKPFTSEALRRTLDQVVST